MPILPVLLGLHGGSRASARPLAWCLAGVPAPCALSPIRVATASIRSRIPSLRTWNAGFSSQFFSHLSSCTPIRRSSSLHSPKAPAGGSTVSPEARGSQTGNSRGGDTKSAETAAPPVVEPAPVEGEEREREIVVETSTVQVVLTNRGGRVLRWRLKAFQDQVGNPVDLVPTDVPPDQPRPFSLIVDDAALTQRLNNALYRVTGDTDGRVDATSQPRAGRLRIRRSERPARSEGVCFCADELCRDVFRDGWRRHEALQPAIAWGPALGDAGAIAAGGSFFTGNYTQPPEAIFHRDGDVERILADRSRGGRHPRKGSFDLRASTITTSSRPRSIPGKRAWNTGR